MEPLQQTEDSDDASMMQSAQSLQAAANLTEALPMEPTAQRHDLLPASFCEDYESSFLQGNSEIDIDINIRRFVRTPSLENAAEILEDKGLVVLCGPPGTGKTTLGRALLRQYRVKDFKPYVFHKLKDWHACVGEGRHCVVLVDGVFGQVRLNRNQYEMWDKIRSNVVEMMAMGNCKLIFTFYPHVLRELQELERGTHSPLLDVVTTVVMPGMLDEDVKENMILSHLKELHLNHDMQCNLVEKILQADISGSAFPWCCDHMVHLWQLEDPVSVYTRPAEAYVTLLTRMFLDSQHGDSFAAVLSLTMLGLVRYLDTTLRVNTELQRVYFKETSRTHYELQRLGFTEFCDDHLANYAHVLKEFILTDSADGFSSRVFYDATGLALLQSFRLPTLLKVCDVNFLVQHVRSQNKGKSSFFNVGRHDIHLLVERIYDDIFRGHAPLICQHPSLKNPEFLDRLEQFCLGRENGLQNLINAADREHGLALLYWSVWSPGIHLSHWCLKATKTRKMSLSILMAVMVTVLFKSSEDNEKAATKKFLKAIWQLQFEPAAKQTRTLKLPFPSVFVVEETKAKWSELRSGQHSLSKCYLGRPSLPIPSDLLSVVISEGVVKIRLANQLSWQLVVRLLSDTEVDEADDDGNTLLHLAADSGDRQLMALLIKSGSSSMNVANSKGQTPYQLTQRRRKAEKRITDLWKRDFSHTPDLHQACKDGDVEYICFHSAALHNRDSFCTSLLKIACSKGQPQVVSLFIQLGLDIKATDMSGRTVLHDACGSGDVSTVKLLIEHGIDVSAKDHNKATALHVACASGDLNIVELLTAHRAEVNVKNKDGITPLCEACRSADASIVKLLLQLGADVHVQDSFGNTPLHACNSADTSTVKMLIDNGIHVNARNDNQSTPLHKSCKSGHFKTAVALIAYGAEVNVMDNVGNTPLHDACRSGNVDTVRLLIERGAYVHVKDHNGDTALHVYRCGDMATVKLLINQGVDINAKTNTGLTPLHVAAGRSGDVNIVKMLLAHGAHVNEKDKEENTPLHAGCKSGDSKVIKMLTDYGADINLKQKMGNTPLHTACRCGDKDIVKMLIALDANINVKNNDSNTPLHSACRSGDVKIVQLLADHGADINARNWNKNTPLHTACCYGDLNSVQVLLAHNADIHVRNNKDNTPLHKACKSDDINTVKLLIKLGADVEARNKDGNTPLLEACTSGVLNTVKLLIENNVDINVKNNHGKIPLHIACTYRCVNTAKLLITHGADLNLKDKEGNSALHKAYQSGDKSIIKLLTSYSSAGGSTRDMPQQAAYDLLK